MIVSINPPKATNYKSYATKNYAMKYSIKILMALITFIIGISAFVLWTFYFEALPKIQVSDKPEIIACQFAPIEINVCQLLDLPDKYDGKWIITNATIYVVENEIIIHPHNFCTQYGNNFMLPLLELDEFRGKNRTLKKVLKNEKPFMKEVDVRIEGTAKRIFDKGGYKRYLITSGNIEIISPFRKFTAKAAA